MTKFKKSIRHVLHPNDLKYCHCFQWPKLYAVAKYGCDSNILKPFSCNKGRQTAYVWRHELLVEVEASKMRWFGTFHGNNMVIKSPHLTEMRWFLSSDDFVIGLYFITALGPVPLSVLTVDNFPMASISTVQSNERRGTGAELTDVRKRTLNWQLCAALPALRQVVVAPQSLCI